MILDKAILLHETLPIFVLAGKTDPAKYAVRSLTRLNIGYGTGLRRATSTLLLHPEVLEPSQKALVLNQRSLE
jgi:hypothetical protein